DVLDLQLTAPDLATARGWAEALVRAGFPAVRGIDRDTPRPTGADPGPWHKVLHVNADPGRSLNLYVRVRESPGWRWALLFRDWLAADAGARADYLAVKEDAAARHVGDATAEGYTLAKEAWLIGAWDRSQRWADRAGWKPGPGLDISGEGPVPGRRESP
ncbi:GrpB family protein, partial [Nakamurella flavida]